MEDYKNAPAGEELNTTPEDNMSVLKGDMVENFKASTLQREEREAMIDRICIDAIKSDVKDVSKEIADIKANTKGWRKALVSRLSGYIVDACNGMITVPEFHTRAGAEQAMWLFRNTHWSVMETQMYFDMVKECCAKMGLQESELEDPDFMESVFKSVAFRVSKSKKRYVPKDEVRVNLQNGTLLIKADGSVTLQEHNADDFLTHCLPYAYDPKAECPMWEAFLNQMLPEKEAQDILAEYIAYGFTHGIKIEKMLVLYGRGANGKSVVLDVITNLVGSVNISNVSLDSLTKDDLKRSMIENKLFNISHESNRELEASILKLLVSGEPVDARLLYVGVRTITDYAKLITSFNILPRAENTHGFHRRFIILPFTVTIDEKSMDVDLSNKLCTELPGILNWMLMGMKRLLKNRAFTVSPMCVEALRKYRMQSDSVLLFFNSCCKTSATIASGKDIYEKYKAFCLNGDITKFCGRNLFYDRIEQIPNVVRTDVNKAPFFNIEIVDCEN